MRSYANTVQAIFAQRLFGKEVLNIWHFQREPPLSVTEMDALATLLMAWVISDYRVPFSEELNFGGFIISSLDDAQPLQVFHTFAPGVVGGVVGASASVNVAAMTRLHTGLLGASNKGRSYGSGVPSNDTNDNEVSPGFISALDDAWDELLLTLLPLTAWSMVVAKEKDKDDLLPGEVATIILGRTDTQVHDMGRRLNNR